MASGDNIEFASHDDKIAAALLAFAERLKQSAEATFLGFLSAQEAQVRQRELLQIASDVEVLAKHPPTATYQAFERLLNKAQGLGANISRETIIMVGSAFIHRPYVRPKSSTDISETS
jgi:hypothetical protein